MPFVVYFGIMTGVIYYSEEGSTKREGDQAKFDP